MKATFTLKRFATAWPAVLGAVGIVHEIFWPFRQADGTPAPERTQLLLGCFALIATPLGVAFDRRKGRQRRR